MMNDRLTLAFGYHRRGQIEEAARIYRGVLADDPGHADALHLLGLVAYQQGDPAGAVDLIRRAIDRVPGEAAYHANLAEAYRTQGRPGLAIDAGVLALQLRPDFAEAANGLGLALLMCGDLAGARSRFEQAMRLDPGDAMARNNLGNVLRLLGEKDAALDHFREAVRMDPGSAESRGNLGQLLLERGRPEEALEHCREAVRLRPDLPEACNNLGNVLRELGRLEEAKARYADALRLDRGLPMAYNNMAQALQEEGRLEDAVAWYEHALTLDPQSARFRCNLASALAEKEELGAAADQIEHALRIEPARAEVHVGLGRLRHEQGRFLEAVAAFRRGLALDPELAAARCGLGVILEELNEFDEAEACFREALRLDPRSVTGLAHLATLLRGKLPDADREALRRLLAEPGLADGRRSALHFGLAHVLDAQGQFADAAAHLERANVLALVGRRRRGQGYEPGSHHRFVSSLIATFTPEFFDRVRGFGLEDERPIFIVGLPRSGTTLTEQILASHSQVFGAGELRLGREDFVALTGMQRHGSPDDEDRALAGLRTIGSGAVRRVAQEHLARLEALDPRAARVADKMPENYLNLGLLAALFPRAKFIHCRRDVRDVAVSCWMTNFRQIRWANHPGHIAARFAEYRRLMGHWREVLPVPVLEVDYEETVADLEGTARRLVSWCGLEWEPACLEFHRTERPVRTASLTQVRQPIYTRSVGRWRHYQSALGPLFEELSIDPEP